MLTIATYYNQAGDLKFYNGFVISVSSALQRSKKKSLPHVGV